MTDLLQQTVSRAISCKGLGVHSGKEVSLKILPAGINSGITFVRSDLEGDNAIQASYKNVVDTKLCTVIANDSGARVSTVEHLMSALWGCGIDNAIIEVNAEEIPIMDGSAEPFVALIQKAGVEKQAAQRLFLKITRPIKVEIEGKYIEIMPAEGFEVDYTIDFEHAVIGNQKFNFTSAQMSFNRLISRARTFGFLKDLKLLQSAGLAQGASLDNAVGIDEQGVMNEEGLRYSNEFVRHKILDCIGDLYLAGARIIGKVSAYKGSHYLHCQILRKIFESPQNYMSLTPSMLLLRMAKVV